MSGKDKGLSLNEMKEVLRKEYGGEDEHADKGKEEKEND